MEFYIDDKIVKTIKECSHVEDLEDVMKSVRKYDMCLRLAKCFFSANARKLVDFMLARRGINAKYSSP